MNMETSSKIKKTPAKISNPTDNKPKAKKTIENFKYRANSQDSSFALAIKNFVKYGDTDIFPFPYETRMFNDIFEDVLATLASTNKDFNNKLNECPPVNISTCSMVGYTGYRWATQIDPFWNVYFLGLVLHMGDKIENSRVSSDVVYSYRFKPDFTTGALFDNNVNWRKFQLDRLDLALNDENIKFIVTCDIADFYTRIYHHRLENALDRLDQHKQTSSKIKKLIQTFSGTNSYGLPVGGPASRILAELALDSLDHILIINNIKFKRYVDDFIIFCETKEQAHSTLTFINRTLMENEGLTLQKHKTNILTRDEFVSLSQSKLNGLDEDEQSSVKAKFMSLPIRFDPYSPNAIEQYEEIKDSLQDFDLLGMLGDELQKSKINQPFSRQLIKAFTVTDDKVLSSAFKIIFNSITDLYPIFNSIIQVATTNWHRFDDDTKQFIYSATIKLWRTDSFILKTELNLAYVVKLLAKQYDTSNLTLLIDIYKKNTSSILITQLITQTMAKWNTYYWLSDLKRLFPTMTPWQRRLFIVSSYLLGDEGNHWQQHNNAKFTFIDKLYKQWGGSRKQLGNLEEAL